MSRLFVCTWSVLLLGAGLTFAQPKQTILPSDGSKKVKDDYNAVRVRVNKLLITGEEPISEELKDPTAIDTMAQRFTYAVTWPEYLGEGGPAKLLAEVEVVKQDLLKSQEKNQDFAKLYLTRVVVRAREVLNAPGLSVVTYMNLVRVLNKYAEAGREEVLVFYADVLSSNKPEEVKLAQLSTRLRPDEIKQKLEAAKYQPEGVKYWALRGLRDLFAQTHAVKPAVINDKKNETRCILALLKLLTSKGPTMEASLEEIEGFRYFRREVIRALSVTRYPSVKEGAVKGQTALELLRIVRNAGVEPAPRWDEQMEAALGLTRLVPSLDPTYHATYVVPHLGAFVADLAERARLRDDEDQGKLRLRPLNDEYTSWVRYATALKDRLTVLKSLKELKDPKLEEILDKSIEVLEDLKLRNPASLEQAIEGLPAGNAVLYQGDANAKITPKPLRGK